MLLDIVCFILDVFFPLYLGGGGGSIDSRLHTSWGNYLCFFNKMSLNSIEGINTFQFRHLRY